MTNIRKTFGACLFIAANLFLAHSAFADWKLDSANSNISYGTVKNSAIGESNYFKEINGSIDKNGNININIDLSSVDTMIELRDQRMRDIVFKVSGNPHATLTGNIDLKQFDNLKNGESKIVETEIALSLVGEVTEIDASLVVIRLADNKVLVVPQNVLFIDADDFSLSDAIETLRGLAGLDVIATVVPMSFYLTFQK